MVMNITSSGFLVKDNWMANFALQETILKLLQLNFTDEKTKSE